jgi:hypothetical protein
MKIPSRNLLSMLVVVLGILFYMMVRPVGQPPGVLAPDMPEVAAAPETAPVFERDDHVMTGLAQFKAKARVVSIQRYGKDREAKIAPIDIVLGWGPLSDTSTFKGVDVAQSERGVIFESYDPKLPKEVVAEKLVNLHVIGADADIDKRIHDLRRGNIVEIEGWLVDVSAADGWRWKGEPRAVSPPMPGSVLRVQVIEAN